MKSERPRNLQRARRRADAGSGTTVATRGRPPPSACTPTSGAVWMESCGWWRGPKNAEPGAQPHGWSGNLREVEPEGDVLRNYF